MPAAQVGGCAARQGWPHLGTLLWRPEDTGLPRRLAEPPAPGAGVPVQGLHPHSEEPQPAGGLLRGPSSLSLPVCLSASLTRTAARCSGCFHPQLRTAPRLSEWKRAHRCLGVIVLSSFLTRLLEPAN